MGEEVFLVRFSECMCASVSDFYFVWFLPSNFLGFALGFFSVFGFDCSVCVKFYSIFFQC